MTIGGKARQSISSWSDTQIHSDGSRRGVPNCVVQQQTQYGGSTAQCGQLVVIAGNGKQSIDAVTVTIGGKAPTHVGSNQSVQAAIDAAMPGDLIMVDPTCTTTGASPAVTACAVASLHAATPTQTASVSSHAEMLLMWKPVRLQGVGAVSSIISANASPSGKLLDPWRRHVNCLFGLTLQGQPYTAASERFRMIHRVNTAALTRVGITSPLNPMLRRLTACLWNRPSVGTLHSMATWPSSCKSPR